MTVIESRWMEVQGKSLLQGAHAPDGKMCVMEAVAYVAGESWSDSPQCACPVISAFLRSWNDALPTNADRDRLLKPLVPRLVGTRNKALEERRSLLAADWLVRVNTPAWLRLAGLTVHADALASLPEITSMAQIPSIKGPIEAARESASAARSAAWSSAIPNPLSKLRTKPKSAQIWMFFTGTKSMAKFEVSVRSIQVSSRKQSRRTTMKQAELEITDRDVASVNGSALALVPSPEEAMIRLAIDKGAPIETIERLVALQEKMIARQAETEFNLAMNKAQAELGRVATDLANTETHSRYASYAALDRKIRPVYAKHGFSLSFDTADPVLPETVRVLCYVSHSSGHSRTYRIDMPSDGKGPKGGAVMSKTHATSAAMSYGSRYLLKAIFNVAVGEDDNDGNGSNYGGLADDAVQDFLDNIKSAGDLNELQRRFAEAYKAAASIKDARSQQAFVKAKDARKAEIR